MADATEQQAAGDVTQNPAPEPRDLGEERAAAARARDRVLAEAELLNAINAAAAGEEDLERILSAALGQLQGLIPFTGGSIALVEGDELVCLAATGPFAEIAIGQRQRRGGGRLWQVVERAEPFLSGDLAAAGLRPTTPLRSYLAMPLIRRGQVFGVLEVDSTEPNAFDAADLALLRRVATALSGPIQLARRFADQTEQWRRLRQLVDVLPEGLAIAGPDGVFVMANAAAQQILGMDLVGKRVPQMGDPEFGLRRLDGSLVPEDDLPLWRSLRKGETVQAEQMLVRNAQEERELPLLTNAAPLRDAAGSILGGVLAFQDISSLRELERSRDELLSSISHDLKTPLTSIKGFAQLLRRRAERASAGDSSLEALAGIEQSVEKMERMLGELQDIARLEMGQAIELNLQPVDLVALARQEVAARQAVAPQHRLQVETALPELTGLWDETRLERVIVNLLTNAVKYSPRGGDVTVSIAREDAPAGPQAVLRVRDQGMGIPAADLAHIFDRFYRARNVVGRIEGTGIGLTSIRQIVQQHGGTLEVESQPGAGSTFTVRLPLTPPGAQG